MSEPPGTVEFCHHQRRRTHDRQSITDCTVLECKPALRNERQARSRTSHILTEVLEGRPGILGLIDVHLGGRASLETAAADQGYVMVCTSLAEWGASERPNASPHVVMLVHESLNPTDGATHSVTKAGTLWADLAGAVIRLGETRLAVVTSYTPDRNNFVDHSSVAKWATTFARRADSKIIIGGDWNNWGDSPHNRLTSLETMTGWTEISPEVDIKSHSYVSKATANRRIDRVFARLPSGSRASSRVVPPPARNVERTKPMNSRNPMILSDHALVECSVSIPEVT